MAGTGLAATWGAGFGAGVTGRLVTGPAGAAIAARGADRAVVLTCGRSGWRTRRTARGWAARSVRVRDSMAGLPKLVAEAVSLLP